MSTQLVSTGVQFPDGTTQTTKAAGEFSSGVVMVFYQASAPTGWTKSTTNNNKALKVVSGSGGGSGGTHGLSSPPSTSHTHTGASHTHSGPNHRHSTPNHSHSHSLSAGSHTLSTSQMPSHKHYHAKTFWGSGDGSTNYWANSARFGGGSNGNFVSSAGGSSSHSHSLSGSITSGGGSNSGYASGTTGSGGTGTTSSSGGTAFAPQYVDVIVCSKD